MDSIILAAGRNERLSGLVAPFMKPLLLVNGSPLIVSLAQRLGQYGAVTIVVAPQNAEAIESVIFHSVYGSRNPDKIRYVIQPGAIGPRDALYRALPMVDKSDRVCVVCADNIVPTRTIEFIASGVHDYHALALSYLQVETPDEAARFTRIYKSSSHYSFVEGPDVHAHERYAQYYALWVGPFSALGKDLADAVDEMRSLEPGNERISAVLECLTMNGAPLSLVEGGCQDVGVPEALDA